MKDGVFGGVDFHCHLDLYPDHVEAIARAEAACVYTLTMTTTPKAWPRNNELVRGKRFVRAALGLHPQLVAERAGELGLWEQYLPETRYVGEVGLDAGPRYYKSLATQKRVFETILKRCAEAGDKILSIHSVRTAPTILDMLEQYLPEARGKAVLHWFTGSKSDARRAAELGCYFSLNVDMTRSEKGRALIGDIPMDRILTETDGPFTQLDGRPSEPTMVGRAVSEIARLRGVSVEQMTSQVRENLKALMGIVSSRELDH
ncbi:Qat anti-phage system TatD family nuclease QatD [Noviherbaspirillum sp. CPCC 100848]|uniref:Qat anti-phage system TatD family nuclease QatD n=1 Tax=Noviherbaspirillum album TaxID=3080276 RepID=A0ABU6JI16_9BURK|nr:Qat anti-phage system TatD family nuclease QatD [Noviherbaspirillum sp. CPCC 100848]MEC4723317.1 Qat anti-phage system TatD family nuclease QatD [Noviherbaspirillum sp. CPCC 100848]